MIDFIRNKNLGRWLPGYLQDIAVRRATRRSAPGPRHVMFAVCDHYEPFWRTPDPTAAAARVLAWRERYPALAERYRDADGYPPRHTFFYPGEEYRPKLFDMIAPLVRNGYGEVELHLHHDRDSEDGLRRAIDGHVRHFADHGHLSRAPDGRPRYAFIHGNWALANSRPDGRWCGVDAELPLLFETGCYADFTFPSAPDPTQPGIVNRIYWPTGDIGARRGHERGERARVGVVRRDRVLMIQGPLAIERREGKLAPRLEYGALTAHDPPTVARVRSWLEQDIHVAGRPEWVFVKVYTHGAPERQASSYLGAGGNALHQALAELAANGEWRLHYVTAREMYNIAMAAMAGKQGNPNDYRDWLLSPPPASL